MDRHQQAVFVARNPGPAAQFFDTMLNAFIEKIVVRHGDEDGGVFGVSEAYYGMVEAHGRGTLHCHLLLWLKGNPSPQELRNRMSESGEYKNRMFSWIESIISCELPGMVDVLSEPERALPRPKLKSTDVDARIKPQPIVHNMSDDDSEFAIEFREFVKEVAIRCNWHEHNDTCYKHLKSSETRGDATCRMRINGITRAFTELDEETQSILLRRLHPRINNFNDVVLFLMQCNMDIKYVGSGESAKALIYYVTDYITKESLATHVGLGALTYAINRNDVKYSEDKTSSSSQRSRSLFVKTVNSMMARQEMSHQQVMSYLIGGGDHYKSDTFRLLKWADMDRFVRSELKEAKWDRKEDDASRVDQPSHDEHDRQDQEEECGTQIETDQERQCSDHNSDKESESGYASEHHRVGIEDKLEMSESDNEMDDNDQVDEDEAGEITFKVEDEKIVMTDNITDYVHRSTNKEFTNLSVWEHCEWVIKLTKKSEGKRIYKEGWDRDDSVPRRSNRRQLIVKPRGKTATPRGNYSWTRHPNFKTHTTKLREVPFTPVLLGSALPRADRGPREKEQWC